jgi:hypothetical protein
MKLNLKLSAVLVGSVLLIMGVIQMPANAKPDCNLTPDAPICNRDN